MKRTIFSALAIAAVAFVSCKKTDPATPSEPGSATISGVITADLNQYDDTIDNGPLPNVYDPLRNPEFPPNTTNITFVINESELVANPNPGFTYQDLAWTVAITNGAYSIDVPAINQPVDVDMYFDEFNADQQIFFFADPDSAVYDNNHMFTIGGGSPVTLSVVNGGTYVYNDTYN